MIWSIFLTIFIWHCIYIVSVKNELYTSISDMENMLKVEGIYMQSLTDYVSKLENDFNYFGSFLADLSTKNNQQFSDLKNVPLRSYLITKRLAGRSDWENIIETIENAEDSKSLQTIRRLKKHKYFPSQEDLNGAAVGLARLQHIYTLRTVDLANGKIKNVQYNSKMSANDCYELGYQTLEAKDYYYSALWLNESLSRLTKDEDNQRLAILSLLRSSHYLQKNYKAAIEVNNEILDKFPFDEKAKKRQRRLSRLASNASGEMTQVEESREFEEKLKQRIIEKNVNIMDHIENPMFVHDVYQEVAYRGVCSGEIQPVPKDLAPLRCRYLHGKSPFLKIAPFKVEEVSLEPYITVYHDVVSDSEIEFIKTISKTKLKRAAVISKTKEYTNARISKYTWFHDDEHEYIENISKRVADMTDLSMKSAEALQIVNYGIGGFYNLHYDFGLPDDTSLESGGLGNRIATILFYMSDVAEGGATAFPMLKRAVLPKKGTAVFWWNLHASGERDLRTKHAGCPVLVGNKWIMNKWLHTQHQEFKRLCTLSSGE